MPAKVAIWLVLCSAAMAQSLESPPPGTRAAEIEKKREDKARRLEPDTVSAAERAFIIAQKNPVVKTLFGNATGFRLRIGGLVSGGGFAVGPEYYRPDLDNGNVIFRVSARGSIRKYQLYDAQFTMPRLLHDHAFMDLYAVHINNPSMNYYGPGPGSNKSGRSAYRLENTSYDYTAALKPARPLKIGVTGGYLQVNVGPGDDDRFISTEKIYPPSVTPGIDRQSNFLRFGPMLQYDFRDYAGNPHSGGNYLISYVYYDDRKLNTGNFRKLNANAEQYISFFNKKRVIALRGLTQLSYRNTNQVVPFYLQPTLGGGDDLRGFRPFRFYDNNSLLLSGEYRWEVFHGFDMAVFSDAGKVFHRHAELNFANLERDYGFGLRFSSIENVFMRIDTGFSREGFQVWIKFGNIF
jgi:outer membrane protein assembly factor BamA